LYVAFEVSHPTNADLNQNRPHKSDSVMIVLDNIEIELIADSRTP
jgi:hypothetical protein